MDRICPECGHKLEDHEPEIVTGANVTLDMGNGSLSKGGLKCPEHLTPMQAEIARQLLMAFPRTLWRSRLDQVINGARLDPAELKTLNVHIHNLRKRFAFFGLKIVPNYGRGWDLVEDE